MHHLNSEDYIRQLSIDCVIFGYQNRQLKVLIPKLIYHGDFSALPGGFIQQEEDIDQAARRILLDRTGLSNIYLEQFRVFGKPGRNNKFFFQRFIELNSDMMEEHQLQAQDFEWITQRFISIGYYALVDIRKVKPKKSAIDRSIDWYNVQQLPTLIMDHREIVEAALQTLRRDLDEKLNAFNLLPETFTMKEVQGVYESVFNAPFVRSNFQKKMLNLNILERLGKKFTGAANKAPYVYRFKKAN